MVSFGSIHNKGSLVGGIQLGDGIHCKWQTTQEDIPNPQLPCSLGIDVCVYIYMCIYIYTQMLINTFGKQWWCGKGGTRHSLFGAFRNTPSKKRSASSWGQGEFGRWCKNRVPAAISSLKLRDIAIIILRHFRWLYPVAAGLKTQV